MIATRVGAAIGLNQAQVATLELAGYLHDIGKIGVPESILTKPAPLTAEEYEIVRQHPRVGHRIVSNIEGAEEIAEIILHHHERWDGKGYPNELKGNEVSLLARILTLADAYDAMTSKRPYRDRLDTDKVLAELRAGMGKQFDPNVVTVFLQEVTSGRISTEEAWPVEKDPDATHILMED